MADGAARPVLDRKLNLVFPIVHGDRTMYVHAMPIRRETFEQYFLIISKTFAAIYQDNLQRLAGARVSALMLRDVARNTLRADGMTTWWEGPDGVEAGLLGEVRRLTNVVTQDMTGSWITMPYEDALNQRLLTDDDIQEVEGTLAFFTVNSAMHRREVARGILNSSGDLWGFQTTSLDLSEYRTSLTTSTPAASTGETVTASSIPS